jgi:hypothetical protein
MNTFKRKALAVLVLGALGAAAGTLQGCAALGLASSNFSGMTADQIAAAAKDRSAGASCTQFTGTGGQFSQLSLGTDAGVVREGAEASLKCGSAEATFKAGAKPVVRQ